MQKACQRLEQKLWAFFIGESMASRLIRDGLLDSEAVLGLPVEARWMFVSILLSADDVGLFEATPFRLARRADVRREHADSYVQMIADGDLIRLYSVADKSYGFIPRYCQRIQIKRARCPLPPLALLEGDDDAINKIKHLGSNPTVDHRGPRIKTVVQPSEPEPEPEPLKTTPKAKTARERASPLPCPDGVTEGTWSDWLTLRKAKRAPVTGTVVKEAAAEAVKAGMSLDAFLRVWCARGSQGLQADWLKPSERGQSQPAETVYQRSMRERVAAFCPSLARKAPGQPIQHAEEFFDVEAKRIAG